MKRLKLFLGSILMLAALISCNKSELDSYPPALNKIQFELSTSQTGKDTLYEKNKKDFKIQHVSLINKADDKIICEINSLSKQQPKLEAGGVTYGEVKYADGEVSLIKI